MAVEKKDLDWGGLDFGYRKTDVSYVSNWKDGAWDEGGLTADHSLNLSECAGIFHYCQACFEGLKAYTTEDCELLQPEIEFGAQDYGIATKKGSDLSKTVDDTVNELLENGWLDEEIKAWDLL